MLSEGRRTLFSSNIALAYHCATKFAHKSKCNLDDLRQEALIALWDATATYDSEVAAFSTYATTCICHQLVQYTSVETYGKAYYLRGFPVAQQYVQEAYESGKPLDAVLKEREAPKDIQRIANRLYTRLYTDSSLDAPIHVNGDQECISLMDVIADERDLAETVCNNIMSDFVQDFFDTTFAGEILKHRHNNSERTKILLRYYRERLFEFKTPLKFIAQEVGMTPSAVSSLYHTWNHRFKRLLCKPSMRKLLDIPEKIRR